MSNSSSWIVIFSLVLKSEDNDVTISRLFSFVNIIPYQSNNTIIWNLSNFSTYPEPDNHGKQIYNND